MTNCNIRRKVSFWRSWLAVQCAVSRQMSLFPKAARSLAAGIFCRERPAQYMDVLPTHSSCHLLSCDDENINLVALVLTRSQQIDSNENSRNSF